ncbi:MAG: ABC transporter permease [Agriterribacter sp.]
MFKNYLKIAWRKLGRQKLLSFVTVFGLAMSLAVCLVVTLFIKNELSYDSFQSRADRISLFRQYENGAGSGSGFAALLKNLSGVEQVTRIIKTTALLYNGNKTFSAYENNFCFADSNFLKIFDINIITGNADAAFNNPDGILISQRTALKYFQDQDAVGKPILYNGSKVFYVTAVFQNLPANSHLDIDAVANFKNAASLSGRNLDGWWDNQSLTYVLLLPNSSFDNVTRQLPEMMKQTKDQNAKVWKPSIVPLRDIYLKENISDNRIKAPGAITEVYIFSVVSLLIIVLAAFNYINITTAKAITYLKEVGVRKIIGAGKRQLVQQFLTESLLNVLVAAILALAGAWWGIALFNYITGASLRQSDIFSAYTLLAYFAAVTAFALINGLYPALGLSSFKPADSVKRKILTTKSRHYLQSALVTFQFTITIVILIALFVVSKQLYYVHHQNLGYNRKQIVTLNLPADTKADTKQTFITQLRSIASVENVAVATPLPGSGSMRNKLVEDYVPKGKDLSYSYVAADENFLSTFDISLLQGENFIATNTPEQHEFLINQSMSTFLELGDSAVGKSLAYYSYQYTPNGTYKEVPVIGRIRGVIADYHQENLRSAIQPMLIQMEEGWNMQLAVKLKSGNEKNIMAALQKQWQQFFPGRPFEYRFMDDAFNETYKSDTVTEGALRIFALLAVFISCLGLFGLTAITIENRIREIGIRKVLGASVSSIVNLMSKDFLRLVLLAALIASPVAWWLMNNWLQNYAYRTTISMWIFGLAAAVAFIIALVTIAFQSIKAAFANPVRSLRME